METDPEGEEQTERPESPRLPSTLRKQDANFHMETDPEVIQGIPPHSTLIGKIFKMKLTADGYKVLEDGKPIRESDAFRSAYPPLKCTETRSDTILGTEGDITICSEMISLTFTIPTGWDPDPNQQHQLCRGKLYLPVGDATDLRLDELRKKGFEEHPTATCKKTFKRSLDLVTELQCYKHLHKRSCPNLLRMCSIDIESKSIGLELMERDLFKCVTQHVPIIHEHLFQDLVNGVCFMHETLHLCHRDIKPENVLVDAHGVFKLADFGHCHKVCTQRYLLGTLSYTLPDDAPVSSKYTYGQLCDKYAMFIVLLSAGIGTNVYWTQTIPDPFKYDTSDAGKFVRQMNKQATDPRIKQFLKTPDGQRLQAFWTTEVNPMFDHDSGESRVDEPSAKRRRR